MKKPCICTFILIFGVMANISNAKMIIDQNFNHWEDKVYTIANAKQDFNNKIKPWTASTYRGIGAPGASSSLIGTVKQETRIVNKTLRAEYTKNDAGGYAGGFLFDPYFDGVEEAYLEYKVKFDKNFFWATGGKLPGLGGSTKGIGSETEGRGAIPSGTRYDESGTGFSARLMWRRNRDQTIPPYFILYSYFAKKPDGSVRKDYTAGDDIRIFTGLQDDTWYTIRQYIKLNTPGEANGVVTMWVNGNQVYHNTKHTIRQSGKGDLKINALIMNTYRGGARTDPVWHSPRDEYAFFDDFKVWTGSADGGDTIPPENKPPVVSITSLADNTAVALGESITITANAQDSDGSMDRVNFRVNEMYHSQAKNKPYNMVFTPQEPGTYTIDARAYDDEGASTFSNTIMVTVYEPEETTALGGNGESIKIGAPAIIPYAKGTRIFNLSWEANWQVYSLQGSVLMKGRSTIMDLTSLVNGIYVVQHERGTQWILLQ
jgi:hypothetical protein